MIQTGYGAKSMSLALAIAGHLFLIGQLFGDDPIEIEGSSGGSTAKLGTSFADLAASVAQPDQPDLISAERPEPAQPIHQAVFPIQPVSAETSARATPAHTMTAVRPAQPQRPMTATPVSQATPVMAVTSEPSNRQALQSPTEPASATKSLAENKPANPTVIKAKQVEPQKAEPLPEPQKAQAIPKAAPAAQKPKPPPKPKAKPSVASTAAVAGQRDGSEQSTSPSAGTSGKSQDVGNKAASNYPGQVLRRIQRISRPRVRSKGRAQVSFRISASGGLEAARISRSSGSAKLDQAALRIIKKAAPFPKPPAGAQRSYSVFIESR